jgi:hypothetical protein
MGVFPPGALSLVVMLNPRPRGPFWREIFITFPIFRVLFAFTAVVIFVPAAIFVSVPGIEHEHYFRKLIIFRTLKISRWRVVFKPQPDLN